MIQQICDPIKIESLSENEFKVYLNSPDHLTGNARNFNFFSSEKSGTEF